MAQKPTSSELTVLGSGPDNFAPFDAARSESLRLIAARHDSELVDAYLGRGGLSAKSVSNTGKELRRFLLWCEQEGLTLRDVRTETLTAYSAFLLDP
jgi:hypothetical protein